MSKENNAINIKILDKEYQIACPPGEEATLQEAATLLNKRMKKLQKSGKVVGLDRIAVITALNLANDFLTYQNNDQVEEQVTEKIRSLKKRVTEAINSNKQLNI